ncbi:MAG TPA: energy-coupling factor transporter transmembrane protein EcfT, partial [Mycobacteriales bacterium]|nr:energy-coupling factor transporter transmembrane protein EcfT [Mycobacteriales bacterium]
WLGLPMLLLGLLIAAVGLPLAGRRVRRSVYRPEAWRLVETLVAGSGLVPAAVMVLTAQVDPANLYPSLEPLSWPGLPLVGTAGVLLAVLPAWLAPPPVSVVAVPRAVTA